ncbi:CPBP family intramembrane glutamic endopeptidase [Hymenobacter sp. APR13]|uniref:CPBP family intramembrane glutamic endopeptidase n=1 Tax=Hymenobacter sp. APR13 TaxID=1356852 RepID=UPI0004E02D67|nr:CPBP family intramembrane glutamic endopeptidase [Hymenobacter sp. APR13]AII54364.1 hypothetical protein N008_20550 [Hymenobacter sp. APR13]
MLTFAPSLRRLLRRSDARYDYYAAQYQARTPAARAWYLAFYLLPGLLVYAAINVAPVYAAGLRLTGLAGPVYQYAWLIGITYGWHLLLPVLVLRYADGLPWRDIPDFLGLRRPDWAGCTWLLLLVFVVFTLLTLPYMRYVQQPLYQWLDQVPAFRIPAYSIFKSAEALYGFPPVWLALLLIGNFVGEEVYFRGYLQKKSAFLGRWNVPVNGVLFAVYHFFQIPQTWPLVVPTLIFPLLMHWRKSLYVVILFHLLINLGWSAVVQWALYGGGQ